MLDYQKMVSSVEEALAEATRDAYSAMAAAASPAERRKVLASWESQLTRKVRPAYRETEREVRTAYSLGPEVQGDLKARLGRVTVDMVSTRSVLEGLVDGKPPTPNSVGGAHPPASTCSPQVREAAERAFQEGLTDFDTARQSCIKGELLSQWFSRVNVHLESAVKRAEAVLKDSGCEYREDLLKIQHQANELFTAALMERDKSADRVAEAQTHRIQSEMSRRAANRATEIAPGQVVEQLALAELEWARELVEDATLQLASEGISLSFEEQLEGYRKDVRAWVGDCQGLWKTPPISPRFAWPTSTPTSKSVHPLDPEFSWSFFLTATCAGRPPRMAASALSYSRGLRMLATRTPPTWPSFTPTES